MICSVAGEIIIVGIAVVIMNGRHWLNIEGEGMYEPTNAKKERGLVPIALKGYDTLTPNKNAHAIE